MSHNSIVEKSVSYRIVDNFFNYFLTSYFFRIMKYFAVEIVKKTKLIIVHSESHSLFMSFYAVFKKYMYIIAMLAILVILICRLLSGLFV